MGEGESSSGLQDILRLIRKWVSLIRLRSELPPGTMAQQVGSERCGKCGRHFLLRFTPIYPDLPRFGQGLFGSEYLEGSRINSLPMATFGYQWLPLVTVSSRADKWGRRAEQAVRPGSRGQPR